MTSTHSTPNPRSRRERPAKPALSRQGIIDAALVILKDEGLNKVTMRRVASALDSGHASLYVYVRDTEDLHAQILDALLGELHPTAAAAGGGTWRERLKRLLTVYGELLSRYPGMAKMALSTQPSGPNYLALVEAILGLLNEGGVADGPAAWGLDLLLLYPTAIAAEHSNPTAAERKDETLSDLRARLLNTSAEQFPHIGRLGAVLLSGSGQARVDWAFDVLLHGILAAEAPPVVEQGESS